jgi:predicted alpha/beta hydrolase family esterase
MSGQRWVISGWVNEQRSIRRPTRYETHVAGLFLVAAPYWGAKDWRIDEFILHENFAVKLPRALRIFLYQSRDDDVVPFSHLALYAEELPQSTVRAVDGHGHEFKHGLPEIIQDIKSLEEER